MRDKSLWLPLVGHHSGGVGSRGFFIGWIAPSTLVPNQTWIWNLAVGNQGTSAWNQYAAMDAVSVVLYELAIRTDGKTL